MVVCLLFAIYFVFLWYFPAFFVSLWHLCVSVAVLALSSHFVSLRVSISFLCFFLGTFVSL